MGEGRGSGEGEEGGNGGGMGRESVDTWTRCNRLLGAVGLLLLLWEVPLRRDPAREPPKAFLLACGRGGSSETSCFSAETGRELTGKPAQLQMLASLKLAQREEGTLSSPQMLRSLGAAVSVCKPRKRALCTSYASIGRTF